jgi:hypothetical protein
MADVVTLGDVSSKDTGSGSQLKTGGRRQHNMPKKCVERKMKTGLSRDAAMKACYPDSRFAKDRKQYKAGKGGGIQNLKPQTREQIRKLSSDMKKAGIPKTKKKGY